MFRFNQQGTMLVILVLTQGLLIGLFIFYIMIYQGSFNLKDLMMSYLLFGFLFLSVVILKAALDLTRKERQLESKSEQLALLAERLNLVSAEKHDFTNHLLVINGLLQLGHHDRASRYLGRLVRESRDNSTVIRLNRQEVASLLQAKIWEAKAAAVELELDIKEQVPEYIRTYELVRMLGNLLDNALEAAREGEGGEGWTRLFMGFKDSQYVIEVANNGPPIPEDVKREILKPGFSTKEGHSGMGMYILKQLAERYAGKLTITNPQQGGTVVSLQFPSVKTS